MPSQSCGNKLSRFLKTNIYTMSLRVSQLQIRKIIHLHHSQFLCIKFMNMYIVEWYKILDSIFRYIFLSLHFLKWLPVYRQSNRLLHTYVFRSFSFRFLVVVFQDNKMVKLLHSTHTIVKHQKIYSVLKNVVKYEV